jgi:putative CocE/NonD family hydrolase
MTTDVVAGRGDGWGPNRDFSFRNGAYRLDLSVAWAMRNVLSHLASRTKASETNPSLGRLAAACQELESWQRHLPLRSLPPLVGLAHWYFENLRHPARDDYWWEGDVSLKFFEFAVPIFRLGGWFDVFLQGTLDAFSGIRRAGRSAKCRENQRLVVGPWVHGPGNVGKSQVDALDFGPNAWFDLTETRLRWYKHWLKDVENDAHAAERASRLIVPVLE